MPTFQNDPIISKDNGTSVRGESQTWMGVFGKSMSTTGGHGVLGEAVGTGVAGMSTTRLNVYGESKAPAAAGATGVWGDGKAGADGVKRIRGHDTGLHPVTETAKTGDRLLSAAGLRQVGLQI